MYFVAPEFPRADAAGEDQRVFTGPRSLPELGPSPEPVHRDRPTHRLQQQEPQTGQPRHRIHTKLSQSGIPGTPPAGWHHLRLQLQRHRVRVLQ